MIRKGLAIVAITLAAAGAATAQPAGRNADDVRRLAETMRTYHPNLYHDITKAQYDAAVADASAGADAMSQDELLVALMHIAVLPGVRDGHGGIFPFDPSHARTLHAYPFRPYEFADGTYVVRDSSGRNLVGARLVAIAGRPLAEVRERVRPLTPHDNDSSLANLVTQYYVTAEVLHGVGLIASVGPAAFTFERGGERFDVTLAPVPAPEYRPLLGDYARLPAPAIAPTWLKRQSAALWTAKLSSGRVWYFAYNITFVGTSAVAAKLLKVGVAKKVRALVVDVRNNPGGDNHTYVPVLAALETLAKKHKKKIVVLISRHTFSAAENFITELERAVKPTFVGEPSGGSPNLYADTTFTDLPAAGVRAYVARIYWQKSTARDRRIATAPQVSVPLTSTDYFAGRDPALAAALTAALTR